MKKSLATLLLCLVLTATVKAGDIPGNIVTPPPPPPTSTTTTSLTILLTDLVVSLIVKK